MENQLNYKALIDLKPVEKDGYDATSNSSGDRRDGAIYCYGDDLKLAVNIAYATGRPLLLMGASGCGKSSIAFNLARVLHCKCYEYVVTSRSQARDICYRFDAVRRLGDAHKNSDGHDNSESIVESYYPYIDPGPLWWVIEPSTAISRGASDSKLVVKDPGINPPKTTNPRAKAVLLIDEIDKAEPDFPNNLLVPLGSWQFKIDETDRVISFSDTDQVGDPTQRPFVIITSNRERDLPETFLRRCVVFELPPLQIDDLTNIAKHTLHQNPKDAEVEDTDLYLEVATLIKVEDGKKEVSVAEYLDAVKAIKQLKIRKDYKTVIAMIANISK